MTVLVGSLEVPTDEADLQSLIESGALRERNDFDVKTARGATASALSGRPKLGREHR